MKTYFDCIPCLVRQTLELTRFVSNDADLQEKALREALRMISEIDMRHSPPDMAQKIHKMLRLLTNVNDPYAEVKTKFNTLALQLYPELRKKITDCDDPLAMAVRLAIAGNIIDFGVGFAVEQSDVIRTITEALDVPLDEAALADFKQAITKAQKILYIGDNAGEIVFDKLLIEQLPRQKITFVVKGGPVINDATMQDAIETGLNELVEVIDNGSDAPGTILEDCSEDFRRRFDDADLIIAKGQGNYETLSEVEKNIFFLVKAKCPVIARHLNCEIGTMVLRKKSITENIKVN
jgi:uncharacterized protein with ATP-grasp and redox domains